MIAYIDQFKTHFSGLSLFVKTLSKTPGGFITARGYRAAKIRAKSARSIRDKLVGSELVKLFHQNYSCLGVEKMKVIMRKAGWVIGRDQVRRLMQINHICGVSRGRVPKTTVPHHERDASQVAQKMS